MRKVVVSLTSHSQRVHIVEKVIESLWRQETCADEIILYLSCTEFPQKEKNLPDRLISMIGRKGFRVKWVEENLWSHKKYFYVLQSNSKDIVITVDDDIIYSDTMIKDLLDSYRRFPKAVSARAVRIMLKNEKGYVSYNEWDNNPYNYADMPRMDLCAIGYAGILYPPMCTSARWFRKTDIKELAWEQDDLWLKYNEIIDGLPVIYTRPSKSDIEIEEAESTALCKKNMYGGENDACVEKLSGWVKSVSIDSYERWFSSLLYKEAFYDTKRKYDMDRFIKYLEELDDIPLYLYGAGKRAEQILRRLRDAGLLNRFEAVIVSDKSVNPDILETLRVKQIDELDKKERFAVVCSVSEIYRNEVDAILKNYNCRCLNCFFG